MLTAIACTPILAGWLAVCVWPYLPGRRGRRKDTGWARLAPALAELDGDLDRARTAEQLRMRRGRRHC